METQPTRLHASQPHPVDRMAEIKAEIGRLEAEYAELRGLVVSGDVSLNGHHWVASVIEQTKRNIPIRQAERVLSPAVLATLMRETRSIAVYLKKLAKP